MKCAIVASKVLVLPAVLVWATHSLLSAQDAGKQSNRQFSNLPDSINKKLRIDSAAVLSAIQPPLQRRQETFTSFSDSLKNLPSKAKPFRFDSSRFNGHYQQTREKTSYLFEQKSNGLTYSSDDHANAPWKKNVVSVDYIKLVLPAGSVPGMYSIQPKQLTEPVRNIQDISEIHKTTTFSDKLLETHLQPQAMGKAEAWLGNEPQVYSEKLKRKLYDSLGIAKANHLFKQAKALTKQAMTEEELLSKINGPLQEQPSLAKDSAALMTRAWEDIEKEVNYRDMTQKRLGDSLLTTLPPLPGREVEAAYLDKIDSLSNRALQARHHVLQKKKEGEERIRAELQQRPRLKDRLYLEGILQWQRDSSVQLVKFSPALAYRFAKSLSLGAGPDISISTTSKKLYMAGTTRAFLKAEVFQQRAYLQVEDNVDTGRIQSGETMRALRHRLLVGGGALLPVSKKAGINLSLLYQVSRRESGSQSPFVFRLGISSIKKTGNS
jgi:hypothetical protein